MSASEDIPALVIGAGPAGLAAAEVLAEAGHAPVIAESMPSPARKFLMAGKSGLNLTRDEDAAAIAAAIRWGGPAPDPLAIMAAFPPEAIRGWVEGLGVAMFTGSTRRVFPVGMKASPLLRAWLGRLAAQGADLRRRWRWTGFEGDAFRFDTPEGARLIRPKVAVLALGGASWPRLGSTGDWAGILVAKGVEIAPFRPTNMGFHVDWSPAMARFFGQPVKGTRIRAGRLESRGEWVITPAGIEGGGIYPLSMVIRDGAQVMLDLAPDLTEAALAARLDKVSPRQSLGNRLRRVLGDPLRAALALEWGGRPETAAGWARAMKALPMPLVKPMPIERAISSAGGITADSLTENLELRALPGAFAAGEMLDWEAPTGGYLLSFCLATGRWAGQAAAQRLRRR